MTKDVKDTSAEYNDCVGQREEDLAPRDLSDFLGIDKEEDLRKSWNDQNKQWLAAGMPEFDSSQPEIPFKGINVRFRNEEDMKKFGELIGQVIGPKTKSIWYPEQGREQNILNKWLTDSE